MCVSPDTSCPSRPSWHLVECHQSHEQQYDVPKKYVGEAGGELVFNIIVSIGICKLIIELFKAA